MSKDFENLMTYLDNVFNSDYIKSNAIERHFSNNKDKIIPTLERLNIDNVSVFVFRDNYCLDWVYKHRKNLARLLPLSNDTLLVTFPTKADALFLDDIREMVKGLSNMIDKKRSGKDIHNYNGYSPCIWNFENYDICYMRK